MVSCRLVVKFGRSEWSGMELNPENRSLTAGCRLDTQQAARFLSKAGILLESWHGTHLLVGAAAEIDLPDWGSSGRPCRTGSRRQLGHGPQAGAGVQSLSWRGGKRVAHQNVWPETGPGLLNGRGQAKPFPGDKFLRRRLKAGSACALNGRGGLRAGACKG